MSNASAQAEEVKLMQELGINEQLPVPINPDVDQMSYEQIMEMQERAGEVSRGYTQEQIDTIETKTWTVGLTKEKCCWISMENFTEGQKVKILPCNHVYDQQSIDEWLMREKRCPLC